MKEKEKKILYDTLCSLKIGSIIKIIFGNSKEQEYYIVNDNKNFCQIGFVEYGVILENECHVDNLLCYLSMNDIADIEVYTSEELTRIKTVLLEIFFGISRCEAGHPNLEEMKAKVQKLKELLN